MSDANETASMTAAQLQRRANGIYEASRFWTDRAASHLSSVSDVAREEQQFSADAYRLARQAMGVEPHIC
jgi:hypothetical protein